MQYRCKECFLTFSVTRETLFAHHKLSLQTYLLVIALFTNAVKSISALQLSRETWMFNIKLIKVLSHKIRESLMPNQDADKLNRVCEIDSMYARNYKTCK